jgi:hypothetical protein
MFRRRRSALFPVLLVLALLAGALEGFAPHTDDGCPTEIHCLACRTLQGGIALAVAQAVVLPAAAEAEAVVPVSSRRVPWIALPAAPSRGPPSSC